MKLAWGEGCWLSRCSLAARKLGWWKKPPGDPQRFPERPWEQGWLHQVFITAAPCCWHQCLVLGELVVGRGWLAERCGPQFNVLAMLSGRRKGRARPELCWCNGARTGAEAGSPRGLHGPGVAVGGVCGKTQGRVVGPSPVKMCWPNSGWKWHQ